MMGTKERDFAPLAARDRWRTSSPRITSIGTWNARSTWPSSATWSATHTPRAGRPSIDPVVFFKLQLILFFEGLRSERQLMRVVADRLSLRWYLGYDLTEPLPDHSSLTRIRERYGLEVFRRFFEAIVEQCLAGGLGLGRGTLHRRHEGRGQRRHWTRSDPASPSRPTSLSSSPWRASDGEDEEDRWRRGRSRRRR